MRSNLSDIKLRSGDIFLSKNPMALGMIINTIQTFWSVDGKSEYSHAGVLVDSMGTTIESLWTVSHQNIHEAYIDNIVLIARNKTFSRQDIRNGHKLISKHKGQIYPFYRLLLMAIPPLGKYVNFGRCVCSELTCKFLMGAGVDIEWQGKNPDNIHDIIKYNKDYEIIYEGKI